MHLGENTVSGDGQKPIVFQENVSSTFKGFIFQPSMLVEFFSRILIGISEQNPINRPHHLVVVLRGCFVADNSE